MLDAARLNISIHALLAESDVDALAAVDHGNLFLSTLSLRRATGSTAALPSSTPYFYPRSPCGERRILHRLMRMLTSISIHALLAESDSAHRLQAAPVHNFYPRSPCGERLSTYRQSYLQKRFLSTLSLRRATSAHRLQAAPVHNFYPRSPCGERRLHRHCHHSAVNFYPRSPCGERLREPCPHCRCR